MTPEEHDQALALTSHLPHVAAAVLATTVPEKYFRFCGSGMLDTTRVAAGDPGAMAADSRAESRQRAHGAGTIRREAGRAARRHPRQQSGRNHPLSHPRQEEPRCFGKLTFTPPRASRTSALADVAAAAAELHLAASLAVTSVRGYLIQGDFDRAQVTRIADELLADRVVERTVAAPVGDPALNQLPSGRTHWIHVLPKPGVMDPVAQSAMTAIADLGFRPRPCARSRSSPSALHDRTRPNQADVRSPHPNPLPKGEGTCRHCRRSSRCCARRCWPTTPSSR